MTEKLSKKIKKIQIGFDDKALEIIQKLQEASGVDTPVQVLRDALGAYDWAHEQITNGYEVGAFQKKQTSQTSNLI